METFSIVNAGHYLLSQKISRQSALSVIKNLREDANYHIARFVEPLAPRHFGQVEKNGTRQSMTAYLGNDRGIYIFNEDHAVLAYPTAALSFAGQAVASIAKINLTKPETRFFETLCRDSNGPIPALKSLIFSGFNAAT